jgi:hypothetical protein
MEYVRSLAQGDSLLAAMNGTTHMREGVVVLPLEERESSLTGRAILKILNPDYLLLKSKKADKGETVDFADI